MKRREGKPPTQCGSAVNNRKGDKGALIPTNIGGDDDGALFRNAVRDVVPLASTGKAILTAEHPQPVPLQIRPAAQTLPADSLSDHISFQVESGDEWAFLRSGVSRQTLRRLRRGYWKIQAELDLHGLTRDKARLALAAFLDSSRHRGLRCLRVIHGKGLGSRNHEPVIKMRIGGWLSQRNDVLAFCQARPEDGGSGAVLVLLRPLSSSAAAHQEASGSV